ncbi:hypothetical protein B0H34DRAFT_806842 [Crassisporium funariophilum]|nr:hypothetical protein B0H34DRAFT_806842 [Crassisporium funariophilum]
MLLKASSQLLPLILRYTLKTDMPWPEFVAQQFELVNQFTTDESEYYGPFNTLLTTVFPPADSYQVSPLNKRITGSMDFAVIYVIMKRKVPVLFIEIKTYLAFDRASSRKEADDQMRDRFLDFSSGNIAIPKLYGISALGTRFSVYEYTSGTRSLTPPRILPDPEIVTDTAPQKRWNYDVMELEGEARFMEIVAEIQEMVSDLNPNLAAHSAWDIANFASTFVLWYLFCSANSSPRHII